jgi:hypothetical protein
VKIGKHLYELTEQQVDVDLNFEQAQLPYHSEVADMHG